MKRRIMLKFGVFLMLGAIVNVAVAWILAVTIDAHQTQTMAGDREISGNRWYGMAWFRFGTIAFVSEWEARVPYDNTIFNAGPGPMDVIPAWASDVMPLKNGANLPIGFKHYTWGEARGYPLKSLSHRFDSQSGVNGGKPVQRGGFQLVEWPWQTGASFGQPRILPTSPIWPGFAINTIFYAAILWLLFTAPGFVRRRMPIKRGLCPACKYPIGTSPVCTECGGPVGNQKP